ncbi:Bifunctional dihydroflavonol 4-reductase/flavanone 4-reductase isoform 3 [Theobroma cacao]|uniref:Bifunctional dihydroflavonol 4-reductase/flavanone 4-reductase isoform 3 n=1 Tax=Theobroma cacao TaxID=3641 RepID=A0A061EH26_THECC|nr:Bifunctional dihydroflavonol 4-reductase/flavanone 4-reductase isoform 3 [Theobroma cacao]
MRKSRTVFTNLYITKDPDLVVEAMSSSSPSQSAKPSASSSASSAAANDQARPRNAGSTARSSGTSAAAGSIPTSVRWDRQTIQFSVNAWVFIVAVLAIFPLVPRSLSNRAYRLSFMGTACSSLYSLYALYGRPRAWNLQAVQVYFQSIIATKDFIYFIYCLTFVTSHLCLKFALIPILCRALEHVAKFLRRNFNRSTLYRKYLEDPCVWVESNTTTLSILSSHAEIGLGLLLMMSLFSSVTNIFSFLVIFPFKPIHSTFSSFSNLLKLYIKFCRWQRNIIQTFMYWQLLKLMYHAPVTAGYHQSVWAKIGRIVNPLVHRYAPFLNTPVSAIQRWWLR